MARYGWPHHRAGCLPLSGGQTRGKLCTAPHGFIPGQVFQTQFVVKGLITSGSPPYFGIRDLSNYAAAV